MGINKYVNVLHLYKVSKRKENFFFFFKLKIRNQPKFFIYLAIYKKRNKKSLLVQENF